MVDYNVKSMGAALDSMCSTADACHGPVRLREGDLYYDSNNPSKIMIYHATPQSPAVSATHSASLFGGMAQHGWMLLGLLLFNKLPNDTNC